ncbi:MAG TPA: low specificity L-threonine aldolase [Steroidobacteraceae bacterium]|nr:low specificity L-threonine aldolase [Steroidobacteraceae bacterium]
MDDTRAAPGWQFASDNTAGICAEAWDALHAANVGYAPSYGEDAWTERACALIRALFEHDAAEVFFVFNGTAANALSLAALARSYHGIVCHEAAHVQTDECAAPEFFSGGAKLLPLPGAGGKLTAPAVLQLITRREDLHYPRPRALSLSQPTEWGTLYRPAEIAALSAVAHANGVAVQMDGARFANALAALPGVTAAELSWRAGVDVLSLGGTKNGLNTSEAVVFFDLALAAQFDYRGKQAGQLASKMRFQSCQWQGVLESGAWLRHAAHANAMAQRLGAAVSAVPGVRLARAVEVNAVFVDMSATVAEALFAMGWHFHTLAGAGYRLMCSWATTEADIAAFARDLQRVGG